MEITIPNYEGDNVARARELQELHIEETSSKKTKIAKETVFVEVAIHNKVGDTQAVTFEFLNERNFNTYITANSDYREWATANHGITWSYEKTASANFDAVGQTVETSDEGTVSYGDSLRKYMTTTLPVERGYK